MAYSTLTTLKSLQPETVLLQLADDDGDGEFDAQENNAAYRNVVSAIEDADTVIDSYLSGRYEVPVTAPLPVIIRQISANLAICNLYERKRELDVPEGIADRRKRYMQILRDIKAETADIPELSKRAPAAFLNSKSGCPAVFGDDLLDTL
jgi:phage gp36-like protein